MGIGTFFLTVGAALIAALACFEAKAWAPKLISMLVAVATRMLPLDERDLRNEEWTAHANQTPGFIGKFIISVGFIVASASISVRNINYTIVLRKFFEYIHECLSVKSIIFCGFITTIVSIMLIYKFSIEMGIRHCLIVYAIVVPSTFMVEFFAFRGPIRRDFDRLLQRRRTKNYPPSND